MPSRRVVTLILLFWFVTTGYAAYRDLWPRLFASGPPPVAIDLADEAAQTIPVRWTIFRGDRKVGRLTTSVRYVEADDTFRFAYEYKQLELEVGDVKGVIPEVISVVRITRDGRLREQSLDGKFEVYLSGHKFAEGSAKVVGKVTDGFLIAECAGTSTFGPFQQTLDPVPVPEGQPLNPLQPVNRIADVKPDRHWITYASSPLDDALAAFFRKKLGEYGVKLKEKKQEALIGEVLSNARDLNWHGQVVSCWVIEYRQDVVIARTWVRTSDGKVLKQEAFRDDEHLTIERDG